MKKLPQLNKLELTQWKEKILGDRSSKFPDAFLFEQLFDERSPLAKEKTLSDRVRVLLIKYPKKDTYEGLKTIFPKALKYIKENDLIDEKTYEEEYDNCDNLVTRRDG